MDNSGNSKWKTRLVVGEFPDRTFDIEFWQEQGDDAIFSAAWEMVELSRKSSMGENPHFKDLLRHLNECDVRYLIVGGYAIMK